MSLAGLGERALRTWEEEESAARPAVFVGTATCGLAAGAGDLLGVLAEELERARVRADVRQVGCIGICYAEPLVDVRSPGGPRVCYGEVDARKLRAIVRDHVARGGYAGLERALAMAPEAVIAAIKASGLRGRGGGGFPTGREWELCRANEADVRYIVCNADEGDPGAFMDRSVLEGDPHAVLEGMGIAAHAIGASAGYVYCRAEYPLALKRLRRAIAEAESAGLLGDRPAGAGRPFRVHVKEGAGAFVCGEETALLASLEGRRGMPRSRPPFPAAHGLFGRPTTINNVETLANVPAILREGAAWFAKFGTAQSKGTKTFALTGKVRRTGLIEVPMGITLREVVYEVGGGIAGGDAVLGPATVVDAIAQGRRAAQAIERRFFPAAGTEFPWLRPRPLDTEFDPQAPPSKARRAAPRALEPGRRTRGFAEVEQALPPAAARAEARRCLRCDCGKPGRTAGPGARAAGPGEGSTTTTTTTTTATDGREARTTCA